MMPSDGRYHRACRKRPGAVHRFGTVAALALLLMACAPQCTSLEKIAGSGQSSFDAVTVPPEGWHRRDLVQVAAGSDLYAVIDGGAALYLKAGFRAAAFALYEHSDGTTLHLEIYQMTSNAAARTVQARKVGAAGEKVAIGDDAVFEEQYLNFVKGPCQVTVYGYEPRPETLPCIMAIARTIAQRLPVQ